MLKLLGILCIFLGTAVTTQAKPIPVNGQESDYLGRIEYIKFQENPSLEEVRQLDDSTWEKSLSQNLNFGFTQDHYWFRIIIKNIPPSEKTWFLRSKYPLLDHIDLYLLSGSELVEEYHSGDFLKFSQRPVDDLSFAFPISITNNKPHVIYIRLQTTSSLQLSLTLQNESDYWQTVGAENAIRGAFYAVLISMLIYNAIIFLMVRVRSYLYYVIYLSCFILLMASSHGLAYRYLWPNNPELNQISIAFFAGSIVYSAIIFVANFLRLKDIHPTLHKILMSIAIFALMTSLISLFAPYSVMIQIIATIGLITALIAIFSTFQEWFKQRRREVLIFIIAWSAVLVGYVLYIAQKFGALPVNNLTEHAVEIGAVLEALLLALGLADRINSERKIRIKAQEYMLLVQKKANEELDNKVRERTDELEVINNQLHEKSITDSLTQIRNRNYFDYKFPIEYRRSCRSRTSIALFILDIDHFKKFNDQYGHQAGDEVLRKVAESIKKNLNRPSDTIFRYGGEEFTVLLPNTNKGGAFLVAEHVRKKIEETKIEWEDKQLSVTISIGVAACIPSHFEGGSTLLQQADDYLYAAKDNGRNQVIYEDNDPMAK
jgi:diguanylate cyclase (GGDEF)-like protein